MGVWIFFALAQFVLQSVELMFNFSLAVPCEQLSLYIGCFTSFDVEHALSFQGYPCLLVVFFNPNCFSVWAVCLNFKDHKSK